MPFNPTNILALDTARTALATATTQLAAARAVVVAVQPAIAVTKAAREATEPPLIAIGGAAEEAAYIHACSDEANARAALDAALATANLRLIDFDDATAAVAAAQAALLAP